MSVCYALQREFVRCFGLFTRFSLCFKRVFDASTSRMRPAEGVKTARSRRVLSGRLGLCCNRNRCLDMVGLDREVCLDMAEPTWAFRPGAGEMDVWRAAAASAGKPFNTWIRESLSLVAEREAAAGRQALSERGDLSTAQVAPVLRESATGVHPRPGPSPRSESVRTRMCEHRVPATAFCGRCD